MKRQLTPRGRTVLVVMMCGGAVITLLGYVISAIASEIVQPRSARATVEAVQTPPAPVPGLREDQKIGPIGLPSTREPLPQTAQGFEPFTPRVVRYHYPANVPDIERPRYMGLLPSTHPKAKTWAWHYAPHPKDSATQRPHWAAEP